MLSNKEFKTVLQSSYLPQQKAKSLGEQQGLKYDSANSKMNTKVFLKDNKPIVVHRGSTRISDWVYEDPASFLGIKTKRALEAQRLNKRLEQQYGSKPINVGHSLGGALAEQTSRGGQVMTYNKLTTLPSIFKNRPKGQIDYRTNLDLPSALSQYQKGGQLVNIEGSYNPIASHSTKYL
jgi:hypothetical protein